MNLVRTMAILLFAVAALGAMMLTNPGRDRAFQPMVARIAAGDQGQARLFSARIDGWHLEPALSLPSGERTSEGVFLVLDLTAAGTTELTTLAADWIGASGRRYATTARAEGLPRRLDTAWMQPGLDSELTATFELPEDEIMGGALLLHLPRMPALEGALLMAPPQTPPAIRLAPVSR